MHSILILLALVIRNRSGLSKFESHFLLENEDDRMENILTDSSRHSVNFIRNLNPPPNSTPFAQHAKHVKRSPRPEILFISNPSLLNSAKFSTFINFRTQYILVFLHDPLSYEKKLFNAIGTSKIIFICDDEIFIPCFPCHAFKFVKRDIFSLIQFGTVKTRSTCREIFSSPSSAARMFLIEQLLVARA